jgi:hypothetical protein
LTRKQDYVAWHGVSAFPILNNYVRGNDIRYLNNKLYLFGSTEEINYQIPALIEIDPSLSTNNADYNITLFRDLTTLSVAKYSGNKNEFPSYLGIGYPHTTLGSVAGQTFSHSLGYADLDASNQLRYGIISRRKYQLSSTDWSLFLVSNVDNDYCYTHDDYLVLEAEYIDYVDTFQVYSQTTWIPSRAILFFDTFALFYSAQCASNEMIFNSTNQYLSSYNQIKFYPNPSASQVNIEGIFTNEEYLIYNLNGTLILKGKLNGLDFIDISRLNSGIYFLELRMNEKIIFREKLSKL